VLWLRLVLTFVRLFFILTRVLDFVFRLLPSLIAVLVQSLQWIAWRQYAPV